MQSIMNQQVEYYQCVICLDPEILSQDTVNHPCGKDIICMRCFQQFYHQKFEDAYFGTCPQIICPVCPNKPILPYDLWVQLLPYPSLIEKYSALSKSLLSLQCASCHTRRSLLVEYDPSGALLTSILQHFNHLQYTSEEFQRNLEFFCVGKVTVNSFYDLVLEYFPSIAHSADKDSWIIFKIILSMIQNPERRANLHLRYLRTRPRAYLTCCNREQCYRCKTRDTHDGKTCDEMESSHDNGLVRCSQCMVYLVKGDGCDTVTCVCGRQFSWSTEREKFESSRSFQDYYPVNTAAMYARVVCEPDGSSLCNPAIAHAWALEHELEALRALTEWWKMKYAPYPSQCTILQHLIPQTTGAQKACSYWQQTHAAEIRKCQSERKYALQSLLSTYFPGYTASELGEFFDRIDYTGIKIRESLMHLLPAPDRSYLQQSIEEYRIQYHSLSNQVSHDPLQSVADLFSCQPNDQPKVRKTPEEMLKSYLVGAHQFLAIYGHLHAELRHLEIKIIQEDIQKRKRPIKKSYRNVEMNRVMKNGSVLCRWSYPNLAGNSKQDQRPYYLGIVTHLSKGMFDVTFTDGSGVVQRLGGLIFRHTLDSESSLYLPKYRSSNDPGEIPNWKPYFFPSIPLNEEQSRLYDSFCNCLSHSSEIYHYESVLKELQGFTDRNRIYRAILPIAKLLEETIFQTDIASSKPQKDSSYEPEEWQEVSRRNKKEKKRQIEASRRSEKMTWRDVFRGVMWKAMRDNQHHIK